MNKEKIVEKIVEQHIGHMAEINQNALRHDLVTLINSVKAGKVCKWTEDADYGSTYNTSCDEMWSFTEDGVVENRAHYCFYCGGKVEVIKAIRDD